MDLITLRIDYNDDGNSFLKLAFVKKIPRDLEYRETLEKVLFLLTTIRFSQICLIEVFFRIWESVLSICITDSKDSTINSINGEKDMIKICFFNIGLLWRSSKMTSQYFLIYLCHQFIFQEVTKSIIT